MASRKEGRLEIRLTAAMKRDIGRAAKAYRTTPSTLMRELFARFKEQEWIPKTQR